MPDERTLGEILGLTADEIDWLERRKTGDLTPRQHLRVNEIQTRAYLLTHMADGPQREALEADCLAFKAKADAVNGDTSMNTLNALFTEHMALHNAVVGAAQTHPIR